jgi:hypothetical protein
VTGQKAISGGNLLSVLRQIDTLDAARYAEAVPEPFSEILRRSLVTDPKRRDISMAEISELLE